MAETRQEYLERFKKIRAWRLKKKAGGRRLIFDEDRMVQALLDREVPTMMQHCILRVYKKASGGSDRERFLSAFNICAAVFQKNGYMQGGSFTMTGKGMNNNRRHQREADASAKRTNFASMANRLWRVPMEALRDERKQSGTRKA